MKNTCINSEQNGYGTELSSIMEAIEEQSLLPTDKLRKFFWEMFIVDALLGNFDRHNGNWGILVDEQKQTAEIAPVYDCGSCLYPQLAVEDMNNVLENKEEIDKRIFVFPSYVIEENGKKISYFEFISSLKNEDCNTALKRIYGRIDMEQLNKINWYKKSAKVEVGMMVGIHTFGSTMNFNPHLHMLVTEGGLTNDNKMKRVEFIPYVMLRKRWQAGILSMLRKNLSEREKKKYRDIMNKTYRDNEGFVIYGPPNNRRNGSIKEQIGYIGRYMKRPAISLNRILEYDGKTVTFKYLDKKDKKEKTETIDVMDFIARIIRHIPDENFKTIRYYGLYSRRNKGKADKILKVKKISKKCWKDKITESTGKNPLMCERCKIEMEYKGEVCLKDGKLKITYAKCNKARRCMEEIIGYEPPGKKKITKRAGKAAIKNSREPRIWSYDQIYLYAM